MESLGTEAKGVKVLFTFLSLSECVLNITACYCLVFGFEESNLILQALKKTGGNKKEAALLLNLKRTTLIEKLKKRRLDTIATPFA